MIFKIAVPICLSFSSLGKRLRIARMGEEQEEEGRKKEWTGWQVELTLLYMSACATKKDAVSRRLWEEEENRDERREAR